VKPSLHFVIGGSRSGKSGRAETLARESRREVVYIATCRTDSIDGEMRTRIDRHRARRPVEWKTVENRFDLSMILHEESNRLILMDSLTLWLSYWQMQKRDEDEILADLEQALKPERRPTSLIIVGDEVGLGLVPADPATRAFCDLCGRANQLVSHAADCVEFMVAGLPLVMKGKA
jgi:adenosylcobinamide kinase / adenosylcobinamide-phosphate guanylyltransferase